MHVYILFVMHSSSSKYRAAYLSSTRKKTAARRTTPPVSGSAAALSPRMPAYKAASTGHALPHGHGSTKTNVEAVVFSLIKEAAGREAILLNAQVGAHVYEGWRENRRYILPPADAAMPKGRQGRVPSPGRAPLGFPVGHVARPRRRDMSRGFRQAYLVGCGSEA